MIQSAYIHIPFCQQICHYCDFTKFFYDEKLANSYLEALANEIRVNVDGTKKKMKTIFIGGGTPTALNVTQLKTLLEVINEKFDVDNCEEFTIEANPGDFDEEKIKILREFGVNRISLGVQVFDDTMLKDLGRLHKVSDVYRTIDLLKKHGFFNISIDLIYSLPHQTVEHFQKTVDEALSFDLPHYSSYSLQIEPKTIFYNRHKKGKLHRPQQEEEVKMYELLKDSMARNGIQRYEISNFAKPGYESKHNLTYWNNEYYYGFGAGASGYLPGERTINIRPLPAYIKKAMADGKPILNIDEIGLKERIEEELFLGLRKLSGVNKNEFINKFGFSYEKLYKDTITQLVNKKWLIAKDDHIHLTDEGVLFGNEVFEQFLLEDFDFKQVN
ncbi:radical SAM family heme chaperone HemW [Ornithinibacillus halophilus]|uniref:Heme chaperone HemW n=1 Tax=Ornithinibacillus halophilus TaxID=930117 RepID=A0A1M5DLW6_9BACI|nr:radical SAM family heme chaperone HemW [Ornithinibacillus halophilus]SHF67762.1 coproporphyrinogen III oxidase, anaerobic [Ornithinibacillus halophilus]